jgi:hypothetical protein
VGKPEGKRPLGRRRWEDNIRMDLREIFFLAYRVFSVSIDNIFI